MFLVLLVGPRVVPDEMERNIAGKHFIQIAKNVEKLLMPIAVIAWAIPCPRPVSRQANRVVVPLGLQSWAMVSITALFENGPRLSAAPFQELAKS